MTHVSKTIFQGLFKNIVFRSVALVRKLLWAILDFFTHSGLFNPLPVPYHMHKIFFLNPLNYYLLQVKKIHGDSVKNESAKAKKTPPLCLFRVKKILFIIPKVYRES